MAGITSKGSGLLNSLINQLSHSGLTVLWSRHSSEKRLRLGDQGINPLDQACSVHDIAYAEHKDLDSRQLTDKHLQVKAWGRVRAENASFGEKAAALLVSEQCVPKPN